MIDGQKEVPWEAWIRDAEDLRKAGSKPEALDDLLVLDISSGNFGGFLCSTFLEPIPKLSSCAIPREKGWRHPTREEVPGWTRNR